MIALRVALLAVGVVGAGAVAALEPTGAADARREVLEIMRRPGAGMAYLGYREMLVLEEELTGELPRLRPPCPGPPGRGPRRRRPRAPRRRRACHRRPVQDHEEARRGRWSRTNGRCGAVQRGLWLGLGRLCGVPRAASRVGLSRSGFIFTCWVFTQLMNKYRDVVSLYARDN